MANSSRLITKQDNFIYLMFALLLLAFGCALAQQFFDESAQRFVQSSIVITLLIAVWDTNAKHRVINRMALFPIAIVLTSAAGYWLDMYGLDYPHLLLMLVFFIISAVKTTKQVVFTGEIDGNKITGAICLYLLLGLIWTVLYTLSELLWAGAFNGLAQNSKWYFILPDLILFSFWILLRDQTTPRFFFFPIFFCIWHFYCLFYISRRYFRTGRNDMFNVNSAICLIHFR